MQVKHKKSRTDIYAFRKKKNRNSHQYVIKTCFKRNLGPNDIN